jgi:excisionase family DNA binding protein
MAKARLTTRQAAERAGVSLVTLQRWIAAGRVQAPPVVLKGHLAVRLWSDSDVAALRAAATGLRYASGNGRRRRRKRGAKGK